MKKSILFICGLALMAAGCAKEQIIETQEEEAPRHLIVDISVTQDGADTRAVKTGWEDGDKVYVVFDSFITDNTKTKAYYMTLTRDGSSWKSEFSDPDLEQYLLKTESGYLAAAYVSDGNPVFKFGIVNTQECLVIEEPATSGFFMLKNANPYTVKDNKLTASIQMTLYMNTVQFFIDGIKKDEVENYSFKNGFIRPVYMDRFLKSGHTTYASEHSGVYGDEIVGGYYKEGIRFCGSLNNDVVNKDNEYVINVIDNRGTKDDDSDDITYTLTKTATLNAKDAVKLPPLTSGKWTKTINGHEFVELGDGLKWATCNIGADTPEAYGDYFAWGEASPKTVYSTETYDEEKDFEDAAKKNWKGTWRMPTESEISALIGNKSFSWVWDDTKKGYTVKSSISGYEGNSIFLPAASMYNQNGFVELWDGMAGCYWTSTLNSANTQYAWYLNFYDGDIPELRNSDYFYGRSVRAVAD